MKNPLRTAATVFRGLAPFLLAALAISAGVSLGVACVTDRASVQSQAPDLLGEFDGMERQEKQLQSDVALSEARVRAADLTLDPADDLPAAEALASANRKLQALEDQFASFEQKFNERRVSPFIGPANVLLPGLGGSLLAAAVPLLGRRGRKLYVSAFRNLTKGQLLTSAGDILKAMGAQHSSPDTEAVANGDAVAVTTDNQAG